MLRKLTIVAFAVFVALWLTLGIASGQTFTPAEAQKSYFGVNAPQVNYYQPGSGYLVDAAKSAERLPGMVWGELPFGGGSLTLLFEGTGTVNGLKSGSVIRPGHGVFKVSYAGDVRNLRLLRPGDADGIFTADGAAALAPAGIVRLMDWTRTNNSPVVKWDDRCKPTDQLWSTDRGAPWEPWLDYAVRHGKDLWLCVPHQADDDYVRQLALLCKAKIGDAPVNLYLEDSNEVWNYQFGQTKWQAAKPGGKEKWHAERTLFIGRAFREVFGQDDKRVRPVLGCGIAHPWHRDEALRHIGDRASELYGLAIAPYFGDYGLNPQWTPQQYADHLLRAAKAFGTDTSNTTRGVRQFKAICDRLGLKLLAYEGGADLGQAPADVKTNAARLADWERRVAASQVLPETAEAVEVYLEWWRREGGAEFVYFNQISLHNKSGVWGLEALPGQRGPKWQAWAAVAKRHPREASKPTTQPTTKPIEEPTTKPTTQPSTQPTTKPTTQPAGVTFAEAFAKRNGPLVIEVKADRVRVKFPLPSPMPDTTFEFDAAGARRVP